MGFGYRSRTNQLLNLSLISDNIFDPLSVWRHQWKYLSLLSDILEEIMNLSEFKRGLWVQYKNEPHHIINQFTSGSEICFELETVTRQQFVVSANNLVKHTTEIMTIPTYELGQLIMVRTLTNQYQLAKFIEIEKHPSNLPYKLEILNSEITLWATPYMLRPIDY